MIDEPTEPILLPAAAGGPTKLDGRHSALLELLDDESDSVWDVLRKELEQDTPDHRAVVLHAAHGSRPRARGRARGIIAYWNRSEVLKRLIRHVVRPDIDLEHGLFLLARLESFDFDARPYIRTLNIMGREVTELARDEPDDLNRPMALVKYMRERGFGGDRDDYHHPLNIHLHRAIERRKGMPLTLTAIYMFVARRAGIRCGAVPVPGHVVLRLYSGRRSILVDPFHDGALRTRRDLMEYLSQNGLVPQPSWFRDADDAHLLHRHILNLMNSCHERGLGRQARELRGLAGILAKARGRRFALTSGS